MNNLIITNDINTVNYLKEYSGGKFRSITKCKAGYMVTHDYGKRASDYMINNLESTLLGYKKGVLHTIQFCPEGGDYYLTVFAKAGKKIKIIDESILEDLTVGTINSLFSNTNLYDIKQYQMVNAKTHADKAYVMNEEKELV